MATKTAGRLKTERDHDSSLSHGFFSADKLNNRSIFSSFISLQCPTCKTIYGVKTGNQPAGKMEYHVIPHSLPGHPDCKTIRIIYNIPPGIQVRPEQTAALVLLSYEVLLGQS